jgi:hypothetical protein
MVKPSKTKSAQHLIEFAEGGRGQTNKMFKPQAAGPVKPAITGKIQTPAPGARAAKGGPKNQGYGLALPAVGGHTAPVRLGKGR